MKDWKRAIAPYVSKAMPITRAVERVARIAVHVKKPTVLSTVGLVSTGLASLAEVVGNSESGPGWSTEVYASKAQVMKAIEEAGAKFTVQKSGNDVVSVHAEIHGKRFWVQANGSIMTTGIATDEFLEWFRQALDRVLAPSITIRARGGNRDDDGNYDAVATTLSQLENPQADEVLASTLPLVGAGRCILLDGKPGVGKTTMAQIIARKAGLGRVVTLPHDMVGSSLDHGHGPAPMAYRNDGSLALRLISPGVVIIDDVDKVMISLATLERIRSAAKLVILTANNGQYDEVLDGALMRAGRVDEVFSIAPVEFPRDAPFDRLSDADWAEVKEWPVAYLNEVRNRLANRPHNVRLDDLRSRLARRTRSGGMLG